MKWSLESVTPSKRLSPAVTGNIKTAYFLNEDDPFDDDFGEEGFYIF